MAIVAGEKITAQKINDETRKVVKRGRRPTSAGPTVAAGILGILRVDGIALRAGRLYKVMTSGLAVDGSVANDIPLATVKGNTAGIATTASAGIPSAWIRPAIANITDGPILPLVGLYVPAGNETMSILLCLQRVQGTGVFTMLGDPTFPIDLWIEEAGDDPGDTGVDI